MSEIGFKKFYGGFLFVLIDFRLQGIDVLPDIIGFILFAYGINILKEQSLYFKKALPFAAFMIILSIFSIYETPNNGGEINFYSGFSGFSILFSIAAFIFKLLIVYYIFMGTKEMALREEKSDIYEEADKKWSQFLSLQLASLLSFVLIFIPVLGIIYIITLLIITIIYTVEVLKFIKICQYEFAGK